MKLSGAMSSLVLASALGMGGTSSAAAPKGGSAVDPFEQSAAPAKTSASPLPPVGAKAPTPPTPGAASAPAAPAPILPPRELEAFMKGFEGAWKCDTQFAAGALWPGSQPLAAKTDITIRKDFDGFSWHGEFKLAKTPATPATSGVFQIGYAASIKQATYLSYDSVGSSMMGTGTISGSTVTFNEEGFVKGARVKVREQLSRQGPRKLYHKVEIDHGKGLQLLAEDFCYR